jgi:hypothetical protein
MNIVLKIRALQKYLFSFLKIDWDINDYPIRYKFQTAIDDQSTPKDSPIPWHAQIINWWVLSGLGNTKEEAFNELHKNFINYKAANVLPRPGIKVPVQFASSNEIDSFEHIAVKFFNEILDLDYYNCFISDGSSLWYFEDSNSIEHYYKKINDIYGIDISDIEDGNLVEIFRRIELLSNNY